jgi:hypothetical protein
VCRATLTSLGPDCVGINCARRHFWLAPLVLDGPDKAGPLRPWSPGCTHRFLSFYWLLTTTGRPENTPGHMRRSLVRFDPSAGSSNQKRDARAWAPRAGRVRGSRKFSCGARRRAETYARRSVHTHRPAASSSARHKLGASSAAWEDDSLVTNLAAVLALHAIFGCGGVIHHPSIQLGAVDRYVQVPCSIASADRCLVATIVYRTYVRIRSK